MSILKSVKKTVSIRPFKAILYGTPGVGKTTFACNAPDALVFNIEDGLDGIECAKYPVEDGRDLFKSVHEVIAALQVVLEDEHEFKTLVIDSVSALERLIWAQICLENGVDSIEKIGFAKGYKYAQTYWAQIMQYLEAIRNRRNMMVILIGHCEIKQYNDPMTDSYDRYNIKLHEQARGPLIEWSDMVLFADQEVMTLSKDIGFNQTKNKAVGGHRVIYTVEDPRYMAKNRYGLPSKILLDWNTFFGIFVQSASAAAAKAATEAARTAVEQPAPESPTE